MWCIYTSNLKLAENTSKTIIAVTVINNVFKIIFIVKNPILGNIPLACFVFGLLFVCLIFLNVAII